jgi:CDP-diacylglycerol---serine O-phosphatidyltransferase
VGIVYVFNDRAYMASYLIFAAAFIDFCDGFVARLLKAESPIGEQLDSLADCVTFGVLPGCIFYKFLEGAYASDNNALGISIILLLPAFLISVFSALRLARFNVDEKQHVNFIGLPTPACAIFTAALPLIYFSNQFGLASLLVNKWVLYLLILALSYLLVSSLPMFSLKFKSFEWKSNETRYIFLAASAVLIFTMGFTGLAIVILLYILLSIIQTFSKNAIQS